MRMSPWQQKDWAFLRSGTTTLRFSSWQNKPSVWTRGGVLSCSTRHFPLSSCLEHCCYHVIYLLPVWLHSEMCFVMRMRTQQHMINDIKFWDMRSSIIKLSHITYYSTSNIAYNITLTPHNLGGNIKVFVLHMGNWRLKMVKNFGKNSVQFHGEARTYIQVSPLEIRSRGVFPGHSVTQCWSWLIWEAPQRGVWAELILSLSPLLILVSLLYFWNNAVPVVISVGEYSVKICRNESGFVLISSDDCRLDTQPRIIWGTLRRQYGLWETILITNWCTRSPTTVR